MEIAGDNLKTSVLDHHGLVAAVCKDLDIANKIDKRLYKKSDQRRIVSAGTGVVALILNGLGFTNRRLYLTPQFFASKPVELLLGPGITAEQLDDHALGKMLDEVSDYGSSQLFGEVAFKETFERKLSKQDEALEKALWHLGNELFSCEIDAEKVLNSL